MRFQTLLIAGATLALSTVSALAQPLVDTKWAQERLTSDDVVFIDLRNKIDGGNYETWLEGHVPGSVHSDYLQAGWRVGRDDVVGLLPDAADFTNLAQSLGVSHDSHVVLIPAGVNSTDFGSAARAYWTFKVFGHETVSILDGGYAKWAADYPSQIETGSRIAPENGDFVAVFDNGAYVATTGVKAALGDGTTTLLDGRTQEQFTGKAKHAKSLQAGHIPGAILLPQSEAYDGATNQLKSASALADIYQAVDDGPIISYCNTGHWAATNWFVLSEVLGRDDVKLYDGSMVEWTANSANPLGTESNLDKLKNLFKSAVGS